MARGEAIEVKKHIQDYVKLRIDFKSSFFILFFAFNFIFSNKQHQTQIQ